MTVVTPDFVASFILDRTLEPAIERAGLDSVTVIDPCCGTGTFLVGAFERLFARHLAAGIGRYESANRAIIAIEGVDVDQDAIAIARDRLTRLASLRAGRPIRALPWHVVVDDGLTREVSPRTVVVGNLPAARGLSVPLIERCLGIASGTVGLFAPCHFYLREFGRRLVEEVLPTINVELIVSAAGAYIPHHGTPMAILCGTTGPAVGDGVHTVLARRGEPSPLPDDPAQGRVWRSIVEHWHEVGYEDDYVSVVRVDRAVLARHPWSLATATGGEVGRG